VRATGCQPAPATACRQHQRKRSATLEESHRATLPVSTSQSVWASQAPPLKGTFRKKRAYGC